MNLFKKTFGMLMIFALFTGMTSSLAAKADDMVFVAPAKPKIKVTAINDTDIKITINKTKDATGYEVWLTSDMNYAAYKNDGNGDYINAATLEKDGTARRTVTLKDLPNKGKVSVKVRAYHITKYGTGDMGLIDQFEKTFGAFSKSVSVSVKGTKTGYSSTYDFSKVKKGEIINFGSYEQDYPIDGRDPIEWVVLDKKRDGLLLLSKYALDTLPYNTERNEENPVTWEASSLREWLNEEFVKKAFNKTEQSMIKKSSLKNNDSSYGIAGGGDTKDKIFLLTFNDIVNPEYGFNEDRTSYEDVLRGCTATKYAVAQGAVGTEFDFNTGRTDWNNLRETMWWLRFPGRFDNTALWAQSWVTIVGTAVDEVNIAVRPAMYIKLKSK